MSSENKIPFVDLKSQHSFLGEEIEAEIQDVLTNSSFILGNKVQKFEEEFASYCGAKYAVGVSSGTDALHLALRAFGVGPGDEVITVPNTYIATVEAILMCGARPVFVDIDEKTYLMDASKLEDAITKKTKAIIPVHLYGQPADMDEICRIAAEHGVKVLEDACQSHGSWFGDKRAGSLADAACFSFYPSKNLGGIGDGGIVVTDDEALRDRISILRSHGETVRYTHVEPGFCSRLHGIQAAVLSVKLKYLDRWNTARRYNASVYDSLLKESPIEAPLCKDSAQHVYHLYVIRVDDRDSLRSYLASRNIETGIHYPIPVHVQPALKGYGFKKGDFPVTEKVSDEILSLPMFPELKESEIERVVSEVFRYSEGEHKAA